MGHRNPQGLFYNEDENFLLEAEHGPQGGDEINVIKLDYNSIQNFGWAISSYGEHYGGKNALKIKINMKNIHYINHILNMDL